VEQRQAATKTDEKARDNLLPRRPSKLAGKGYFAPKQNRGRPRKECRKNGAFAISSLGSLMNCNMGRRVIARDIKWGEKKERLRGKGSFPRNIKIRFA